MVSWTCLGLQAPLVRIDAHSLVSCVQLLFWVEQFLIQLLPNGMVSWICLGLQAYLVLGMDRCGFVCKGMLLIFWVWFLF